MMEIPRPPAGGVWFVTGARGFVGRWLLRRLSQAGCEVLAVGRTPPEELPPGVSFVACDITNAEAVSAAVAGRSIRYGVHLAAYVGDWGPRSEYEATNVAGTRHVLTALVEGGASCVIHISSISVMGFHPAPDSDELVMPFGSGDAYSDTKAAGEQIARELQQRGAPVVILRPGDIHGIGSDPWVERPLKMMRSGQMMLVGGGQGHYGPVHVENLIDAIFLAVQVPSARGQTYIITDGRNDITIGEWFRRLAQATGAPPPHRNMPAGVVSGVGLLLEGLATVFGFKPPITRNAVRYITRTGGYSIDKARRELGYSPRLSLEEALVEIGRYYGDSGSGR